MASNKWRTEALRPFSGALLIEPLVHQDARGAFMEVWSRRDFEKLGIEADFVQDNQSLSRPAWTLRGIHFQRGAAAQAKLVRCLKGAFFDVAVDLRPESVTFGQWAGAVISAANRRMIYIPKGFGHAFLTLEPETQAAYKADAYYAPEAEGAVRWNDPFINIHWPLPEGQAPVLSAKDAAAPLFAAQFGAQP